MNPDLNDAFTNKRTWGPYPRYPKVLKYEAPKRDGLITIAGPCSIESADQIHRIANHLGKFKVKFLRGGLFRAGTYPSPKFGWVDETLMLEFSRAARQNNMRCIIEVLDYHPETLPLITKYADAYQIGARQMQNYMLLKVLSKTPRPIFLKRNMGATMDEFLGSAEWLLSSGSMPDLHLIERGSSSFANHVRWDLSISMIPAIKKLTQIPIIVDASHGTGRRDLVEPMTLAGVAAGADGFLVETHYDPDKSLSDAEQAVSLNDYQRIKARATRVHEILKVPCEV